MLAQDFIYGLWDNNEQGLTLTGTVTSKFYKLPVAFNSVTSGTKNNLSFFANSVKNPQFMKIIKKIF